jgi:hypothetical protein
VVFIFEEKMLLNQCRNCNPAAIELVASLSVFSLMDEVLHDVAHFRAISIQNCVDGRPCRC